MRRLKARAAAAAHGEGPGGTNLPRRETGEGGVGLLISDMSPSGRFRIVG